MTDRNQQRRQRGGNWDEDEGGYRGNSGNQGRIGGQAPSVQDRGAYGGWASGEGQGEYAGDGYSAQGQFSNQRVAQYGDQGYDQEYGHQGIGWQNRHHEHRHTSGQGSGWEQGPFRERPFTDHFPGQYGREARGPGQYSPQSHEGYGGEGERDWHQDSGGGYWGQGAGGGQGIGGRGSWRAEQSRDRGGQAHGSHDRSWAGGGGGTGYSAAGSWMAGPHSGRGPQGYQRSDARIEEDICEHLTHHGMLDATGIQVRVENGEVTLTGTVESRQAKRLAEDILEGISGVRDIHNQLRLQQDQGHQNPFMAQSQMGQGEEQSDNGQSESRGLRQRDEAKTGAGNI